MWQCRSAIAWPELAGVDFLKPALFRNGHVRFATAADPGSLTSTGGGNRMAAAARNPHAIMFTWQQRRACKRLRDLLTGNGSPSPTPYENRDCPVSRYGRSTTEWAAWSAAGVCVMP